MHFRWLSSYHLRSVGAGVIWVNEDEDKVRTPDNFTQDLLASNTKAESFLDHRENQASEVFNMAFHLRGDFSTFQDMSLISVTRSREGSISISCCPPFGGLRLSSSRVRLWCYKCCWKCRRGGLSLEWCAYARVVTMQLRREWLLHVLKQRFVIAKCREERFNVATEMGKIEIETCFMPP